MHTGSCLCGTVTFEITGQLGEIDACHCRQCRQWTGHFLVSTDVPRSALKVHNDEHVRWYNSSEKVRRGFCCKCGSSLFFDPLDKDKHDWTGVSMGAIDPPTDARLSLHIFVAEKGDYYDIADDLPKNDR